MSDLTIRDLALIHDLASRGRHIPAKQVLNLLDLLGYPGDLDRPCEPVFRSRTRCGEPRCETHDQPWPCPENPEIESE